MIILDGNSLAARVFFASHYNAPVFNKELYEKMFVRSLMKVLTDLAIFDDTVFFCVDSKSWRHEFYPQYKGNRAKQHNALYYQYLDCFDDMIADIKLHLPIGIVKKKGYEADDLLAWFVITGKGRIVLVSTDKDIKQLQSDRVQIYSLIDGRIIDLIDTHLHLWSLIWLGDVSDNIDSVVPLNESGKKVVRFGEKTFEKYYEKLGACALSQKGWDLFSKEQQEIIVKNIERNRKLIDLGLSPVVKEKWDYSDFYTYPPHRRPAKDFLSAYLGESYYNNQRQYDVLMEHFEQGVIPF